MYDISQMKELVVICNDVCLPSSTAWKGKYWESHDALALELATFIRYTTL